MKKFFKLFTLVLIMALFILTPGFTTVSTCLINLAPVAAAEYTHKAPTQSATLFDLKEELQDLASWTKPTNDYLLTQQVTPTTNSSFHDAHEDNTINNEKLAGRSPYVMINDTDNMSTSGAYTTGAITLSPNSYYTVSVDYYVTEQANKDPKIKAHAFGTFYLNNQSITLNADTKWNTATFYIRTDKLENASVTPELCFGSRTESAIGGIYFDRFAVTAINANKFETELAKNPVNSAYIDFSRNDDYVLVNGFNNTDFEPSVFAANAVSYNNINTATIPETVGFADEQNYFYHKDGLYNDVMMLKAYNSNATLTLNNYTLQTNPYEVYMFQFYSIASTATEYTGFYLMIGDTAQQIANLADYPHYNGWQLNTVFFIAGPELNKEYQLKFTLSNSNTVPATGWACIDDFKIYKVNGSYATNNKAALGVHSTINKNTDPDGLAIANSNFNLGQPADNVNIANSSYPYPLVANDWETNSTTTNGIVNLTEAVWHDRFGAHPGQIKNNENNHVYMMHNDVATKNILTSPVLTTTAGKSTYISFDACSTNATQTRAYIFTAETDDEGKTTNEIVLKDAIQINDGNWQRYEFEIIEDEFASSRNYYLRFEMQGTGYAFFDNVRTAETASNTSATVDLTNLLPVEDAWKTTDSTAFDIYYANGLNLKNIEEQKTVIQNSFSYNLTANEYFEITVDARGNNAYLGLNNYTGLLQVTTDEVDPETINSYKLYLQAGESATTINFQVTLGITADEEVTTSGDILIKSIKLTKITEDQFNLAQTNADSDSRLKVLSATEEETEEEDEPVDTSDENNFFGENWWFLIPSLITGVALLLGITAYMLRKIKFDRHIVKKTTSYARDMRLKNQQNKIVAQKATKVDNVVDESQNN